MSWRAGLPEELLAALEALELFDGDWYQRHYPDVAASGLAPLAHFVRYGWALGMDPVVHYLRHGHDEGRPLSPSHRATAKPSPQAHHAELLSSPLFDADWYLAEYPDIARAGLDPAHHYLNHGAGEGREPSPWFDSDHYQRQLAAQGLRVPAGQAPLLHYLRVGRAQGLSPRLEPQRVPAWYPDERPPDTATPRVLYVLSVRTGGTPQTNADLMRALGESTRHAGETECLVLHCRGQMLQLSLFREGAYLPLARHVLAQPLLPLPHTSDEYDRVVAGWLSHYRIGLVHVRHIAWHGLGLLAVAKRQGLPVVFSLHDFYTLCPSVKLLDERLAFCAGRCTASSGECGQELWPPELMPPLKHRAIHAWQRQFGALLAQADALVTTSPRARQIIVGVYPALAERRFEVIPHGRDFARMHDLANPPAPGEPLRVVLPGYLTLAKGGALLEGLAEQAEALNLELHVVGSVPQGQILPASVTVHGRYSRDQLADKLAEIRPHLGAVLSIWPETYCHVLTELWACGLPVLGIDLGAVGERIAQTGAGWLAATPDLESVQMTLARARTPDAWHTAHRAVKRWQAGPGRTQSCATMAERYRSLYYRCLQVSG